MVNHGKSPIFNHQTIVISNPAMTSRHVSICVVVTVSVLVPTVAVRDVDAVLVAVVNVWVVRTWVVT